MSCGLDNSTCFAVGYIRRGAELRPPEVSDISDAGQNFGHRKCRIYPTRGSQKVNLPCDGVRLGLFSCSWSSCSSSTSSCSSLVLVLLRLVVVIVVVVVVAAVVVVAVVIVVVVVVVCCCSKLSTTLSSVNWIRNDTLTYTLSSEHAITLPEKNR